MIRNVKKARPHTAKLGRKKRNDRYTTYFITHNRQLITNPPKKKMKRVKLKRKYTQQNESCSDEEGYQIHSKMD